MVQNPHDAFFRAAMATPAAAQAQLLAVLPRDIVDALEPGPPQVLPVSFVDEDLRSSQADLLLQARLRGGQDLFIYCLLEHQSKPDPLMPWRLLAYIARIWDGWLREHPGATSLPLVFPVVVYQGGRPWDVPLSLSALLHSPTPGLPYAPPPVELRYHLEDLGHIPEEQLTDGALLGLIKLLLKFARDPEALARHLPRWVQTWRDAEREGGLLAMKLVLRYIVEVANPGIETPIRQLIEQASPQHKEQYMTWAQAQHAEGMAQGMAQGERKVLRTLLSARFGALTPAQEQRLNQAQDEELMRWATGIFSASSAQELLGV